MKSYLLSWLARRYAASDLATFVREQPSHWLVWEAGPWRPPAQARDTVVAGAGREFSSGESLAIVLAPRTGPEGEVRLGRAPDNDVVIDDATLSRAHLSFWRDPLGAWTVRDLGSSNGTRVDGVRAGPAALPLETGARIEAGSVRLTFYDAAGLAFRLKGAG